MGILDTGKDLAKLAQQLGNIEIQHKVIDLQGEVLAMQEELQGLRTENAALKDQKQTDGELELRENAYWRPSAADTRQGPFCKTCWDTQERLVSLNIREDQHQFCPSCEGQFPTTESRQNEEQRRQANRAEVTRRQEAMRPPRFR